MTAKELADLLNGRQYGEEMTSEHEAMAKEHGLVVVHGYSDDNTEFRGAFSEEISSWDGGKIFFNKEGNNFTDEEGVASLTYMKDKDEPEANMIEAVWAQPYDSGEGGMKIVHGGIRPTFPMKHSELWKGTNCFV